jgi:hypothetical protein
MNNDDHRISALNSFDPEMVAQAQRDDPHLSLIIQWLEGTKPLPATNQLRGKSCEVKTYYAQYSMLSMFNGTPYRKWVNATGDTKWLQLIPAMSLMKKFVELSHTRLTGGHLGLKKTLEQDRRTAYEKNWQVRYCKVSTTMFGLRETSHKYTAAGRSNARNGGWNTS